MVVFILIVTTLVIAFLLFPRRNGSSTSSATIEEIPAIVSHLARLKDGSFAVFMFKSPLSTDGDAVNLQYSVEQGAVGLDWVLLGKTNKADKEQISAFAARMGHPMTERVMNNVHYLRAEGGDLDMLGSNIISQFYGIPHEEKLDLITEGFDWLSKR